MNNIDKEELEEYTLVFDSVSANFIDRINELIKKGWKLYGSTYYKGDTSSHCQAMIKYKEKFNSYSV
jgi:hypothetical protein